MLTFYVNGVCFVAATTYNTHIHLEAFECTGRHKTYCLKTKTKIELRTKQENLQNLLRYVGVTKKNPTQSKKNLKIHGNHLDLATKLRTWFANFSLAQFIIHSQM